MAGSTTWLSLALVASACGAAESMLISVPAGPWLAPAVASAAQATGLQLLLLRNEFPFHALKDRRRRCACGGPAARAPGDSPGAVPRVRAQAWSRVRPESTLNWSLSPEPHPVNPCVPVQPYVVGQERCILDSGTHS